MPEWLSAPLLGVRAGRRMADSTAMTVDFLRARLLSERSVSRAAKERADELAKRVRDLTPRALPLMLMPTALTLVTWH